MTTTKALTLWAATAGSPVLLLPPTLQAREVSPVPGPWKGGERGHSSVLAIFLRLIPLPEIIANEGSDSAQQT